MVLNAEGAESAIVTDSVKKRCDYCGGTQFFISTTFDNMNDVTGSDEASLGITNVGNEDIQAQPLLCKQCGHQNCGVVLIFDIASGAVGTAVTFTNLVSTVADNLEGWYAIYLDAAGTDTGKYYVVDSNTAANPSVLTMTIATNNNEAGYWCITNQLPVGFTAAS